MNFHLIRQITKFKSVSLLNSCACRSSHNYSPATITELTRYLYIDHDNLHSDKLENSLRYRNSSLQKVNISRLRFLIKALRKQSTYKDHINESLNNVNSEIKKLQEIMKPPNDDILRRISLCENKRTFIIRQREAINQYYNELNGVVLNEYLSVSNDLHEKTPKNKIDVIFQSEKTRLPLAHNHLMIGEKLKVLNYQNSSYYFLRNDATLLEFASLRYFSNVLQKNNFQWFLNPDTCNNFVIDGTSDGNIDNFFKLEGDKYSLVGCSSFSSFCALRIGQSAHSKYLPERHVTQGRNYTPQTRYKTEDGLYSVFQRSDVHFVIASETEEQMNDEFHKTLDLLKFAYEEAELDFRISYQPANDLLLGESLRANIELYSIYLKKYVEVAHISMYGDFVSKRLFMLCHDKNRKYEFLNIIDGVAVSYPTLLAYLLERSNEKQLHIPECLRSLMYKKL